MKNKGYAKFGGWGGGQIRCIMGDVQVTYRPFPYSKNSHFQNEAKCKNSLVETSFICMGIKTHFVIIGCALRFTPYRMAFRADMDAICYSVNTYPICDSPLLRSARCSFAPKSTFLRVNGSPILYDFRAGARAIQRSVNDCEHSLNLALKRGLPQLGYGLWFKAYTFLFSY